MPESPHMKQKQMQITSDPRAIVGLIHVIRDSCNSVWHPHQETVMLDQLELAVQEAATNIIRHAYQGQLDCSIRLEMSVDADKVTVCLYHDGRAFDASKVPPPSFDGSRFGGFGLYLIEQSVDRVEYLDEPKARGVRLVKNRPGRPATVPNLGSNQSMTVEEVDGVAVFTVNLERLELSSTEEFKRQIDPVTTSHDRLILDMHQVQFIDSAGCGAILSCLKKLSGRGGDLKLIRISPPVQSVFQLIRLHKMCDIYQTQEEAINSFKESL